MLLTTICYLIQNDHVLLLHRQKKTEDVSKGKYLGLGGKADAGESPRQCVLREVQEESGLTLLNPQLQGIITFPFFNRQDEVMFLYTATETTGELIDCAEGTLEWIPCARALEVPMWPGDRVFLPWVFAGKFFEAIFRYNEQLEFVSHDVVFHDIAFHG